MTREPWRTLDLTRITGQTVEITHVFNVHLGETIVPYAVLDPLKAILPLKPERYPIGYTIPRKWEVST